MRIDRFEIENFKNLENAAFDWADIAYLIGENNTCKSAVLQALEIFLSGRQIKDRHLFRHEQCDEPNAISLTAHFSDLSDSDVNSPAVRGRIMDGKWILRKKFWLESGDDSKTWKECYYSYQQTEHFEDWPDRQLQRSWNNWPARYADLIEETKAEIGNNRVNAAGIELLKEKIRDRQPDAITTEEGWSPNPGGGGNWKSNANSIIPEFIFVRAVHEVSAETKAKEASTYGKIVNLIFERQLCQRAEYQELLTQIDKVKALFTPNPDHPEWEQAEEVEELQEKITEKLSEIIRAKARIETTDIDVSTVLLPSTVLKIDDGFLTSVDEQGHGLQRTLLITLFQILNEYSRTEPAEEGGEGPESDLGRSVIFGIEEPELYLHPQMLRKIKGVLHELAANPRYQVICPTHSPVLLDLADNHQSIVRFVKDDERNILIHQVGEELFEGQEEQREQARMIAEFTPTVNELFFAKRVVLVEGKTEVAVFQKAADLLELFENPLKKYDTTLVDCCGKSCIPLFMTVLNHFGIPYVVIHDIDKKKDKDNKKIRDAAGEGVVIRTFDKNIEAVLGYKSGKGKVLRALQKVSQLHEDGVLPDVFVDVVRDAYGVPKEGPANHETP